MISGGCKNGLSTEVTAENHEDVLVFPDELLPHLLAVVAFEFQLIGVSCLFPFQVGVRQDNGTVVRMLGDDSVCPIQNFVAGVYSRATIRNFIPAASKWYQELSWRFGSKVPPNSCRFANFREESRC